MSRTTGVLALQGAFEAHSEVLTRLGEAVVEVRSVDDLGLVSCLVLPGGESGTMSLLLNSTGLHGAIEHRLRAGMPVLGTCAGLILLASEVRDARPGQRSWGAIDIAVRRNAYGRQIDSFEDDVEGPWGTTRGVFIRAPRVERTGPDVEVLAVHDGTPVAVRQGRSMAVAFHPELTADDALHRYFLRSVCDSVGPSSHRGWNVTGGE